MNKKSKKNKKDYTYINKLILFIILVFSIMGLIFSLFLLNKRKNRIPIENIEYYEGNIYSINGAANMLDIIDTDTNKVISPFNINVSNAILYNGVDNDTYKEFNRYFHNKLKKVNNDMEYRLDSIKQSEFKKTKYHKLYEFLMNELIDLGYQDIDIKDIEKLNTSKKEEMLLLIKKINLTLDKINGKINISDKQIKKYTLNKKEKNINSYYLKEQLTMVLDNYETYKITNEIINYNELITNNLNDKLIDKDYKDILDKYNSNISKYDFKEKETITTINNNIKDLSSNNINRVIESHDLENNYIMLNSLYFNYEWDKPFSSNMTKTEPFYKYNNEINTVNMMYERVDKYLENEHAYGFIKDFEDENYSFVAVLPKSTEDVLASTLDLETLLLNPKEEKAFIGLPEFHYNYITDIKDIHNRYKIKTIYNESANFSKITNEPMHLSKNIEAINIRIGEKGTINSKVDKNTLEAINRTETDTNIVLNRPFYYFIINNQTDDVMLIGKVTDFDDMN